MSLGKRDLGGEDKALVALEDMTAAEVVPVADIGVPVTEVEGELLYSQRQTSIPVAVVVVSVSCEETFVGVAIDGAIGAGNRGREDAYSREGVGRNTFH